MLFIFRPVIPDRRLRCFFKSDSCGRSIHIRPPEITEPDRPLVAHANASRDWRIYVDVAQFLIAQAGRLYAEDRLNSAYSHPPFPEHLRRIRFKDAETGKTRISFKRTGCSRAHRAPVVVPLFPKRFQSFLDTARSPTVLEGATWQAHHGSCVRRVPARVVDG